MAERSTGSGSQLPVVRHLGSVANEIGGRLGCSLANMVCTKSGANIVLDIPGVAMTLFEGMEDIRARGTTPRAVRKEVERKLKNQLQTAST